MNMELKRRWNWNGIEVKGDLQKEIYDMIHGVFASCLLIKIDGGFFKEQINKMLILTKSDQESLQTFLWKMQPTEQMNRFVSQAHKTFVSLVSIFKPKIQTFFVKSDN